MKNLSHLPPLEHDVHESETTEKLKDNPPCHMNDLREREQLLSMADAQHRFQEREAPECVVYGREINSTKENQPLFYIYDDGTVEKKIIPE